MMNSSDYVPVNKKKYIRRLIELEAENKALRRKIHVYEDLLHRKILSNDKKCVDTHINCANNIHQQTNENILPEQRNNLSDNFKETAKKFLDNPNENENVVSSIVQHMITPKINQNITKEHIQIFLHEF